jgi:hypothetical protein
MTIDKSKSQRPISFKKGYRVQFSSFLQIKCTDYLGIIIGTLNRLLQALLPMIKLNSRKRILISPVEKKSERQSPY